MKIIPILFAVILFSTMAGTNAFAEKTVSIQKTVDVDEKSLIDTISKLELYSQILPDYIQSSRLIDENMANLKIGLDWIAINAEIKFVESNDKATLEVVSGDFKGTKLFVTTSSKTDTDEKTDVTAEINLQTNWYMGIMTSFVSDDDLESMLHTSLNGLVEHTKNPQIAEKIEEKEDKFCIFTLCF